jgi:hypothetical protein
MMHTDLLRTLATNFAVNRVRSAAAIREMYLLDPAGFPLVAAEVLRSGPELPGARFVMSILTARPGWLRSVCDPENHTLDESLEWVRRAHQLDPLTELKLAEMLALSGLSTDAEARFAARVFGILKASPASAALPALRHLSKSPNAHVRSKAVLLIGLINQNPNSAGGRESDSRVSANAVEALWGLSTPGARQVFLKAAQEGHHRIAANGIVGLYRMGEECAIPFLFQLSRSENPLCRAAAAWAMGELEDPRFLPGLALLVEDPDPRTRLRALRAAARVRQRVMQLRGAGAVLVQLRALECRGAAHTIRLAVNREDQPLNSLDTRHFVVWSGAALVEEFSSSLAKGAAPCYAIAYQAPPAPANRVRVEVYAAEGVGEDSGTETEC